MEAEIKKIAESEDRSRVEIKKRATIRLRASLSMFAGLALIAAAVGVNGYEWINWWHSHSIHIEVYDNACMVAHAGIKDFLPDPPKMSPAK